MNGSNSQPEIGAGSVAPGPKLLTMLRRVPLFGLLWEAELQRLARCGELLELRPGAALWEQGEKGDFLALVLRGRLVVERIDHDGALQVLQELGPGAAVGETSLFLGAEHDTTIRAATMCRLFLLRREPFWRLVESGAVRASALRVRTDIVRSLRSRLPWLAQGEQVILRRHAHVWAVMRRLPLPIGVAILGLVACVWLKQLVPGLVLSAAGLLWSLWRLAEWGAEELILTDCRLVWSRRLLPFWQLQMQAPLDKIQDIVVFRSGLCASVFGYGDLQVQTAGAAGQLVMRCVPQPERVKEEIFAQVKDYLARQRALRRRALEGELRRQLGLAGAEADGHAGQPPEQPPAPAAAEGQPLLDRIGRLATERLRGWFPSLWERRDNALVLRKHWIVLAKAIALPASLLTSLCAVRGVVWPAALPEWPFWVGATVLCGWLWWHWENWRNDLYVLTSERLCEVQLSPLGLRLEQREASLDNVQNVSIVVPGLLANLLNCGHVRIETAGQVGNLTFEWVLCPAAVQAEIFRCMQAKRERELRETQAQQQAELVDLLAAYERVRQAR